MNDRTRHLLNELETHRTALREAVESVPPELRDQRPAPGRWSVAEILEHLLTIERRVTQNVAEAAANVAPGSAPDTPLSTPAHLMEKLRDRSVQVDAPERLHPAGKLRADEAWQQLVEAREGLCRVIEAVEDRDLSGEMRLHPILGEMNLYDWLCVLGGHEARHAMQIREAGATLRQS